MIISRTPFRVSFLGGGTDYPAWYRENGGAVLATSIDKYCYISCRYLPPFFEHKSRVVYSKVECVQSNQDIQHPSVRETLNYMKIKEGIEVHHDGDLPARAGLGSSSSFTVGLLHSLHALKRTMISKEDLAKEAIHVERDILKESVGSQDQVQSAFGGLNLIEFMRNDQFNVSPVIITRERLQKFQSHLMLYFTGFSRFASEIAKEQIASIDKKKSELKTMSQMVGRGLEIITGKEDLLEFGRLLHESWQLKRSLTNKISTETIDQIYEQALKSGATGGKLLGAGGGGFVLLFVSPEKQAKVKEALNSLLSVPFQFENTGTQIVFYRPNKETTDASWFKFQKEREASG